MKDNTLDEKNILIKPLALGILIFVSIILIIGFLISKQEESEGNFSNIEQGWVDEEGNSVSLDSFCQGENEKSIFYTIDKVDSNNAIIFAVRNTYVDIYQDGVLIEKDNVINSRIFGESPGTKWHFISLIPKDTSTTIELRCTLAYPNSHAYISNCYLGKSATLYRLVSVRLMPDFLLNEIWIVFSVIMIITYVIFKRYFKFKKDLLFLSVGALLFSTWCGVETRMFQYFFGHAEMIHLLGYVTMLLIPIPFGLLAIERFSGGWKKMARIYTVCCEIIAVLLCFLHVTGILEFHYSLRFVHGEVILLLPFMTKLMKDYSKEQSLAQLKKALYIGYGVLVVFLAVGMIRYLTGHYSDYAVYLKVSLFALIIIMLVYQMAGINEVFIKGLQAEFVKDMAMLDHLTKFYNRTGFAEHYEGYEDSQEPLGIIAFDINNLKKVNDLQGHEKGDELICLASSGIYESFSCYGNCYRMGGDEFLVVLTGENPKENFKTGIENFEEYCKNVNAVQNRSFDVEVAYGFTIKYVGENLSSATDRADALMYEKKRQMKSY